MKIKNIFMFCKSGKRPLIALEEESSALGLLVQSMVSWHYSLQPNASDRPKVGSGFGQRLTLLQRRLCRYQYISSSVARFSSFSLTFQIISLRQRSL